MSKEEKKWPGPPGGVSTTDGKGGHQQVVAAPSGKGRRRLPGQDILQNVGELKVVRDDGGLTPAGTKATKRDVRVGNMPKTRRSRRHHTSFHSIDGEEYVFRTHDQKGNRLDYVATQVLYMSLREISLGGSALPVLAAFNVNFNDETGKQFLPVPPELLNRVDDPIEDQPELALGQADL